MYGVSFDGESELEFTRLDLVTDVVDLALRYRVGWFAWCRTRFSLLLLHLSLGSFYG